MSNLYIKGYTDTEFVYKTDFFFLYLFKPLLLMSFGIMSGSFPCSVCRDQCDDTFGVFLAAASRPSYVSQGRKAVATSYGEFSTCSFSLRFSADVWMSQGSCKAASR